MEDVPFEASERKVDIVRQYTLEWCERLHVLVKGHRTGVSGDWKRVAQYARSVGVPEISIHPIIGRHAIPYDFSRELTGSQLRGGFKNDLRSAVAALRQLHPEFTVNVLNPDLDPNPRLGSVPGYYSPPLPDGARARRRATSAAAASSSTRTPQSSSTTL